MHQENDDNHDTKVKKLYSCPKKAPVSSKQSEGWDPCKEVKEDTGQGEEELAAKNSNTSHQSQPTTQWWQ